MLEYYTVNEVLPSKEFWRLIGVASLMVSGQYTGESTVHYNQRLDIRNNCKLLQDKS